MNKFANAAQGAGQARGGEEGGSRDVDRGVRGDDGRRDERKREAVNFNNNNTNSTNTGMHIGSDRRTEGAYALPGPNRIQENKSEKSKLLSPTSLFSDVAASTTVATGTAEATGAADNILISTPASTTVATGTAVATGAEANILISTPARIMTAIASPLTLLRGALFGGKSDDIESNANVNEKAVTEELTYSKNGGWGGKTREAW